jgi:hypothetical protein
MEMLTLFPRKEGGRRELWFDKALAPPYNERT